MADDRRNFLSVPTAWGGVDNLTPEILSTADPTSRARLEFRCGADFVAGAKVGDFMELRTYDPDSPNVLIIRVGDEWPRPAPGSRRG